MRARRDLGIFVAMNNSGPVRPSYAASGFRLSRRWLLQASVALAALPVVAGLPAATHEGGDRFVRHRGWVLRADDLPRLGRA